jgi:cation diffusion facilitator family transporter
MAPVADPTQNNVSAAHAQSRRSLTHFAWLSISAAIVTAGLKATAWRITGSVGLLSDAMETSVNLVAALMALAMLTVAARPADEDHTYGHSKAEYFSSGVEGSFILIAAVSIAAAAISRLLHPRLLDQVGLGLVVSVVASMVNLGVAQCLLRAGRSHKSITLEADGHHLMTDVWTSLGVVGGVGLVALTGWQRLDPLVGLAVAANVVRMGVSLVRRSILGLMDTALSAEEHGLIKEVWKIYQAEGIQFHALRSRQSGGWRFVSMHVLVPGGWTVHQGHQLLERVEGDIRRVLPNTTVFTHLESLDDPVSWDDIALERSQTPAAMTKQDRLPHPNP